MTINKNTDTCNSRYNNLLFLENLNVGVEDFCFKIICLNYNLTSMVNKPTCYKNPGRPHSRNSILTNCPLLFQSSCVIETGLSDFDKMLSQL